MRNFVAKNDFNRASTHASARDYCRLSKHELYELLEEEFSMEEDWGVSDDMTKPDKPPKQEVSKWDNPSRNQLINKGAFMLINRLIGVLDIESLGVPNECAGTNIVMPTFAFVFVGDLSVDPYIIYGRLNSQEQINRGASISARTVAFWMGEALMQTDAAHSFNKALQCNKDATITVLNPTKPEGNEVTSHTFMTNADAFNEVTQITDGIREIYGFPKNLRFYGNGPQFDMSIYETISSKANEFDNYKAIVPWAFWDIASARNPRDYFEALGGNWKAIEREGAQYAKYVIDKFGLTEHGIVACKHDPVFDALVEAYCIKTVESKLKI
ncbi:hypothetical protein [Bacteriophage Eos]|nr:hypothetical protein [Bacteriophage Eos]